MFVWWSCPHHQTRIMRQFIENNISICTYWNKCINIEHILLESTPKQSFYDAVDVHFFSAWSSGCLVAFYSRVIFSNSLKYHNFRLVLMPVCVFRFFSCSNFDNCTVIVATRYLRTNMNGRGIVVKKKWNNSKSVEKEEGNEWKQIY